MKKTEISAPPSSPVIQGSLWNNDMVKSAMEAMSKSDRDKYAKMGESFYKDVDYETSTIIDNTNVIPPFMKDAVLYIEESIKSGLHPSMMTLDETELLKSVYGTKWYEKYGYVEGDLTEIITVVRKD
jgi:hypothetical protein